MHVGKYILVDCAIKVTLHSFHTNDVRLIKCYELSPCLFVETTKMPTSEKGWEIINFSCKFLNISKGNKPITNPTHKISKRSHNQSPHFYELPFDVQ